MPKQQKTVEKVRITLNGTFTLPAIFIMRTAMVKQTAINRYSSSLIPKRNIKDESVR